MPSVFAPVRVALAGAGALALLIAASQAQQPRSQTPGSSPHPTPQQAAGPSQAGSIAQPGQPTKPAKSFITQILVPGSHFHGVHGLAFNKDDQLFVGSVLGQTIYRVNVDSGDVDIAVDAPAGMADDIAFAPDGTMAWTAFLTGAIYIQRPGQKEARVIATGLPGVNSLAFKAEKDKEPRLFASQVFLGDALWEIDLKDLKNIERPDFKPVNYSDGQRKPLMSDIGGLNGFEFLRETGELYGPLWFRGQVVRIDVDKVTMTVVADGFRTPAAVSFDRNSNLLVVDTALGQIVQVNSTSGEKTLVASLKPGLDNVAIDGRGRVFVTNMVDNGVYLVDTTTGGWRTVIEGRLAIPSDIAVHGDGDVETLHLADVFSYRTIDGASGAIDTKLRMQGDRLEYPLGVSVNARHVILTSWFTNSVQRVDRQTGRSIEILHEFKAPMDAIETTKGEFFVLEAGGTLVKVAGADGKERTVVAKDLAAPTSMVEGPDNVAFVSETATGTIVRIDLGSGARTIVADNLKGPEGIALGPDGRLYVAEVGTEMVLAIDPRDGSKTEIARNIRMGLRPTPGLPPAYVVTGVAVGRSGTVYVTSDKRNAIYKLIPQY
jgi:sugar lactone lactonase YvrE